MPTSEPFISKGTIEHSSKCEFLLKIYHFLSFWKSLSSTKLTYTQSLSAQIYALTQFQFIFLCQSKMSKYLQLLYINACKARKFEEAIGFLRYSRIDTHCTHVFNSLQTDNHWFKGGFDSLISRKHFIFANPFLNPHNFTSIGCS